MAETLVFDSLASNHIPARDKSALRRWVERTMGATTGPSMAHVGAGVNALRQGAESLVVGAALGAIHANAKTGLDVVAKGHKIPLDGAAGAALLIASAAFGADDMHHDIRHAGATGVGIFGFRKTYDYLAEKKLASGTKPGGAFGPAQTAKVAGELEADDGNNHDQDENRVGAEDDDPIVALAKTLG